VAPDVVDDERGGPRSPLHDLIRTLFLPLLHRAPPRAVPLREAGRPHRGRASSTGLPRSLPPRPPPHVCCSTAGLLLRRAPRELGGPRSGTSAGGRVSPTTVGPHAPSRARRTAPGGAALVRARSSLAPWSRRRGMSSTSVGELVVEGVRVGIRSRVGLAALTRPRRQTPGQKHFRSRLHAIQLCWKKCAHGFITVKLVFLLIFMNSVTCFQRNSVLCHQKLRKWQLIHFFNPHKHVTLKNTISFKYSKSTNNSLFSKLYFGSIYLIKYASI
jgi:hypothetical protein